MFALKPVKNDILIDIETFGTGDDCVIVSIAALIFNLDDPAGTFIDSLHIHVDTENQPGRVCDASTVMWWMKGDMEEARKRAFSVKNRTRLGLALKQLDDFVKQHRPWFAWGCAPDFDMGILEHAYRQHRQGFPVPFWRWQDVRTIENFFYGKNTRKEGGDNWLDGVAHDALDDCKMEISVLQECRMAAKIVAEHC